MSAVSQQIVHAARLWRGVRFKHQGRSRHGVDCLGLLVMVAADCGLAKDGALLAEHDERDYGHIPDARRLYAALSKHLKRVDKDQMQAGDVLLLSIDENAQHVGIVGDGVGYPFSLIHAYAPARKVAEHRLDEAWQQRIVAVFRFEF